MRSGARWTVRRSTSSSRPSSTPCATRSLRSRRTARRASPWSPAAGVRSPRGWTCASCAISTPAGPGLDGGLVTRVVAADRLRAAAEELAAAILAGGPEAIRLQKELIVRWRDTDLATAMRYGIHAFATAYATDEPREGMTAYLEKRRPNFGG